ncbi:uncharacterized protein LOC126898831 [Daktulosphaira vitifoliae]|uniref:uncharacterized protein LOC126898831 n=1 Tax=Daktulosphaira vitifoliae TaxID=58002 RepID=UPI0021AA9AFD|nr:uncharacterized protein LOC126898831 [Daktulosphaira vitifoliae]XP_050529187.1 uncharacterized protein LOC126898831 [Daktulosphaira vitifoliae]XP_050529188.1 uncharacterized protein LOC126898831 [Daktulosphaira vitifoliae]XP_050529189.1 uncharacterized protein LOC126898831 [Daktulosphaira vitifoliae]
MLKHVHRAKNSDTVSIVSTSNSFLAQEHSMSSRCSSVSSLNISNPVTTIKVYTNCLRADLEYKTLGLAYSTTCSEVISILLKKYRMRHRDPNLFYMTMEINLRKIGLRTVFVLDNEACPAVLQSCHPQGESRFCLQSKTGGLVKVYDGELMPGSKYKSLLISDRTTIDELIRILLNCCSSKEQVEQFSLYEVSKSEEYQRKLHHDDLPLKVQCCWPFDSDYYFLLKRNLNYKSKQAQKSWKSRQQEKGTKNDYENLFYI